MRSHPVMRTIKVRRWLRPCLNPPTSCARLRSWQPTVESCLHLCQDEVFILLSVLAECPAASGLPTDPQGPGHGVAAGIQSRRAQPQAAPRRQRLRRRRGGGQERQKGRGRRGRRRRLTVCLSPRSPLQREVLGWFERLGRMLQTTFFHLGNNLNMHLKT